MKDKLEPNMYVRTKHYGIFKILNVEKVGETIFLKKAQGIDVEVANKNNPIEDEIIKIDANIMKLILVGDYINGSRVIKVVEVENYPDLLNVKIEKSDFRYDIHETIFEKDIKSIVTKQQFSSMEYRLGDDK